MMKKTIAAGTIALTLAGAGSCACATDRARRAKARGLRPSAEDVAAFTDARVAGLKAGLKLTAEQEKNWPAVETAIRDLAKERADRMKERAVAARRGAAATMRSRPRPDAIARLRQGADAMTTRAAEPEEARRRRRAALQEPRRRPEAPLRSAAAHGRPAGGGHGHWQRRADNAR